MAREQLSSNLEGMSREDFNMKYTKCISENGARNASEKKIGPNNDQPNHRGIMIFKAYKEFNKIFEELKSSNTSIEVSNANSRDLMKRLGLETMRIWFFGKPKELATEIMGILQEHLEINLNDNGPFFEGTYINDDGEKMPIDADDQGGGIYWDFNDADLIRLKDIFDLARIVDEDGILWYTEKFNTQSIHYNLQAFVEGMLSFNGDTLKPE